MNITFPEERDSCSDKETFLHALCGLLNIQEAIKMEDAMTNLKVITVAQENVIDNIMEMECKLLQRNVLNSRAVFN